MTLTDPDSPWSPSLCFSCSAISSSVSSRGIYMPAHKVKGNFLPCMLACSGILSQPQKANTVMLASYSTGPLKMVSGAWGRLEKKKEIRYPQIRELAPSTSRLELKAQLVVKAARTPEARRKRNRCPPERDREVSQQRHPTAGEKVLLWSFVCFCFPRQCLPLYLWLCQSG